ncbi:MAG: hypothetical protein WC994_10470 [Brumimicrobium sp.]
MDFTQEQITTILTDFSNKSDNGYERFLKFLDKWGGEVFFV